MKKPQKPGERSNSRDGQDAADQAEDGGIGPTSLLLGSGAVVLLALTVVRRFRARGGGTKKGKIF